MYAFIFFFNATATTEIYTLSLHDALPIFWYFGSHNRGHVEIDATSEKLGDLDRFWNIVPDLTAGRRTGDITPRSEEHTSELQSRQYLVCRLLLEKKKRIKQV